MSTSDVSMFEYRCDPGPQGVYVKCYNEFSTSNDSLAKLDYPDDFVGEIHSSQSGSLATRFYRSSESSEELKMVLFGEVLDEHKGTGFGAMGGSTLKCGETMVTEDAGIRDIVALGPPTGADEKLSDLFNDQITTLTQIYETLPLPGPPGLKKREYWKKYMTSKPGSLSIIASLPYKYSRPAPGAKLKKRDSDLDVADSKREISLEDRYAPSKMHDYDPDVFKLGESQLVQQPFYDKKSKLIYPWEAPFTFKKGALVVVEGHLVVYHFVSGPNPSHLYQIVATGISIQDPSPLPYKRVRHVPLKKTGSGSRGSLFSKLLEEGKSTMDE